MAWAQSRMLREAAPVGEAPASSFSLPRTPIIYLIGTIALFSMIPEGAILEWGAVYLRQELGAGIGVAGFAFAAFSATMALVRFVGDGVRNRFGAVATLRASSLVAAGGMLLAGAAPNPTLAILAFAFAGLGIANMVPIAFSAAGNQPGSAPGVAISTVTVMGYSGILVAPSIIGFVAERTGFAPIFLALAALPLVVTALAGFARQADRPSVAPAE
jgi:fucose permease